MPTNGEFHFPLDASVLQRLDNLALLIRRPLASNQPGRRRSPRAGSSMEFADYRRYAPGDDFRRIDWRAYARLERLFLRVFEAEENLPITILLDCSESMFYGSPSKIDLAIKLTASLAYIAIKNEDTVYLGALTNRLSAHRRAGTGTNALWHIGDFLAHLPRVSEADLNRSLYDLGRVTTQAGLTIVISDFLAPSGYQTGIRALRQLRQEVALLQVLAPEEMNPEIQGDWNLRDSETKQIVEVSVSSHVLHAYQAQLETFLEELAASAHANQAQYTCISSDTSLLEVVQRLLRQISLVK